MTTALPRPKSRVMATWKIKEQLDEGFISLDADYQRDVKWDQDKMSYLIDSIFTNYYIPPLLFAIRKLRGKNTRMVIDGKQRLSAVKRFMNNEFPYMIPETDEEKYYCNRDGDEDSTKSYLTEDEMEIFNSFEFVCVEYNGITEDEEYEIFSRVQLGVAITNQEKLRAHNTPVAKTCRELAEQFKELKTLLSRKNDDALLFQLIAQMYFTLKNGPENFQGRFSNLLQFVKLHEEPPTEHDEIVMRTLTTLASIAKDPHLKDKLMKRNDRSFTLKPLELLVFMMFRKSVGRPRTIREYANDFACLRQYLYEERGGKFVLGKDSFQTGLRFVENRLEDENLAPITRPFVHRIESDSDELKEEEYEQEPVPISSPPPPPPTKRRRPAKDVSRPTARRGGMQSGGGISRK